jgi:hypothetical protein
MNLYKKLINQISTDSRSVYGPCPVTGKVVAVISTSSIVFQLLHNLNKSRQRQVMRSPFYMLAVRRSVVP